MNDSAARTVRKLTRTEAGYRWDGVAVKEYPATGTVSDRVTKQVLFAPDERLPAEWRYFEVSPGGYSGLEKHQHVHAVMVLRGAGRVLVGEEVWSIQEHDLVYIPPETWHQFYAASDSALGFLCLVNGERDRPTRPSPADITELEEKSKLSGIIRY
ncbi:MAG: cupin domain-containing protein [Alkalispirochaeta sp.]